MIQDFYIHGSIAYLDAQHTMPVSQAKLKLSYGDECTVTLHFDAGTLAAGDTVMVAYDADMLYGAEGTHPMGKATAAATAEDAASQSITLTMATNTERFYQTTNGARVAVTAYFGIYLFKAGAEEGYPQIPMALCVIYAMPVVSLLSDTVVPIEPTDIYYTKSEVDALFLAKSGGTMSGAILSTAGGYQQNIVEIPAADITYTLEPGKAYKHSPSAASTYTLPDIADTTATQDISISVTFSAAALSCAFVDAQGNIIPMLRTPDIAAGQTYEFECTYNNGGWRIMPISLEVEV